MTTTEIVVGPPGTGKTTSLIADVQRELDAGTPPDRIGYVSFTRRAAHEARDRARERLGLGAEDLPHFRTLHSLCFRQLGLKRGEILEGQRLQEFAEFARVNISGRVLDEEGTMQGFEEGDRIVFAENLSRITLRPLEQVVREIGDDQIKWPRVKKVAAELRIFKDDHGLRDFTDLLQEFVDSGVRLGLETLFVDEAQDLSPLQWLVVDCLARDCRRVVVAGDDDQGIYRWAGADVRRLIEMDGTVRPLEQSWRVPPLVQAVANRIIDRVKRRRPKTWRARTGGDGVVVHARNLEKVDVERGSVLVLARNSYVLRDRVEPWLRDLGIPYVRNDKPGINLRAWDAVRAWESLRRGRSVSARALRGVYDFMHVDTGFARGFARVPGFADEVEIDMGLARERAGLLAPDRPWFNVFDDLEREEVQYIRGALRRGERPSETPRVIVSTIHGSKGAEADHVVLMKDMAARTWRELQESKDQGFEDEARVWYVGSTRAKEKLTVVESETERACPWL